MLDVMDLITLMKNTNYEVSNYVAFFHLPVYVLHPKPKETAESYSETLSFYIVQNSGRSYNFVYFKCIINTLQLEYLCIC